MSKRFLIRTLLLTLKKNEYNKIFIPFYLLNMILPNVKKEIHIYFVQSALGMG
mgnify:CR=1 FL=1